MADFFGDHSTPATNDGFVLEALPGLPAMTDLAGRIVEPTLPPFAPVGGFFNVTLDLANLGTTPIDTAIDVEVSASATGDPFDPGNVVLDTIPGLAVSLSPGQFVQESIGIDVPAGLPLGDYFLVTTLDSSDVLPEDDEQNNVTSTFQFVTFGDGGGAPSFLATSRWWMTIWASETDTSYPASDNKSLPFSAIGCR